MDAQQARKVTEENANNAELIAIQAKIEVRAKAGKFSYQVNGITDATKAILIRDGYKVTEEDDIIKIKW